MTGVSNIVKSGGTVPTGVVPLEAAPCEDRGMMSGRRRGDVAMDG